MDVCDTHDGQSSGGLVLQDDLFHGREAVLLLDVELQDSNRGPVDEKFQRRSEQVGEQNYLEQSNVVLNNKTLLTFCEPRRQPIRIFSELLMLRWNLSFLIG